ncbi:MAG: BNR-4 repeat-containing protein [Planctomycetales bacterium]|nr:BNR-4 repeat-containing protein [Planctomycetales bacterium]
MKNVLLLLTVLVCLVTKAVAGQPVLVKSNGGWCWFQGERAVVVGQQVIFTSISSGQRDGWNSGDLVVTSIDITSSAVHHHLLSGEFQSDDHDVAGLCVLPDNRILAVYGKHNSDAYQRSRLTLKPGDITRWTDESKFDVGAGYTYANVFSLSAEDHRIYNFHRGRGFNPNCTVSSDLGVSWSYGFRLLEWTREDIKDDPRYTGLDGSRPYLRYASRGVDTIHFFLSDDHPRAYDNSVYHGYYRNGKIYASDGTELATPGSDGRSDLKPHDFTEIFTGNADHVAWPCDICVDENERPRVVFSVQVGDAANRTLRSKGGADHRYYFGRWTGWRWDVYPIAHAGTKLYAGEDDYTGLAALDPQDDDRMVISTNADPVTGSPLISSADNQRHWELFEGNTSDGGKSWRWTAITANSTADNLRPIIPKWDSDHRVLLWAKGKLSSYTDYDLDIYAQIDKR